MFLIIFWLGAATTVTAIGIDSNWKFEINGIPLYKEEKIIIPENKDPNVRSW